MCKVSSVGKKQRVLKKEKELKSKPTGQEAYINLLINYYLKITWQMKSIYIEYTEEWCYRHFRHLVQHLKQMKKGCYGSVNKPFTILT